MGAFVYRFNTIIFSISFSASAIHIPFSGLILKGYFPVINCTIECFNDRIGINGFRGREMPEKQNRQDGSAPLGNGSAGPDVLHGASRVLPFSATSLPCIQV